MLKKGLFSITNSDGSIEDRDGAPEDRDKKATSASSLTTIDLSKLEQEGSKAAGRAQGDFVVFKMWVNKILAAHVQHATRHSNIAKNRVRKIDQEIERLESRKSLRKEKKNRIENELIPQLKDRIREKRLRVKKIKSGDAEGEPVDKLGYYLSVGILVALTMYLVIFYTSVIYGAFIYSAQEAIDQGVAAGGDYLFPTIVNLDAIPSVYSKYGVLGVIFLIVSTSMFIALGYLIHKFQENKNYFKATGLLAFTFIFDAILAYEIVEVIHEAKYMGGMVEEAWNFSMIFTQVPFYIIIFAGFAIYVIWGLVLNYIFEEREKMRPGIRAIEQLNGEIDIHKDDLDKYHDEIESYEDEINKLESEIRTKEVEKEKEFFDKKEVGQQIGNFVTGWVGFIRMSFDESTSDRKIEKVKNHVEIFMTRIEEKAVNPLEK